MSDGVKVLSNWSILVNGFNASAMDFYNLVEANVQKTQAPALPANIE